MTQKFEIDWDTADRITAQALRSHYAMTKESLEKHLADPDNNWMHVEDVGRYTKLIRSMKDVLEYYGETNLD